MLGIIGAIIVGAIAGWLANIIMKGGSSGLIMNILLGIAGGFVGSFVLSIIGISGSGPIGSIIVGVIGACIIIAVVNFIKKR